MAEEVSAEQIQMLDEVVARAWTAADITATYDQERVDRLCQAVAAAVCDMKVWAPICDEAVDETDLGDKVTKCNRRDKIKLILHDCLRNKSVGITEEIPEKGLAKYAKPVGAIAIPVPTTNSCLTPTGQIVYVIKAKDVLICSPYPRVKNVTNKCINIIRETLVHEGVPADIIQGTQEPSISLTQELMRRCNLVTATGGRPMVEFAYSSGVPAFGSGAGNVTVIIDDTTNTPEWQRETAMNIRISKTSDLGSGCSCDGNLLIHESVYDGFVQVPVAEGVYLASEEEVEKLKNVMWDEIGHRLLNTVVISPQKLAEIASSEAPADRKLVAVTDGGKKGVGKEHFFPSEGLTTLLTLFKYEGEFESALDMMRVIFEVGGRGHSCGIYSWNDEHIHRLGMAVPVSRIMIRQPNNRGSFGSSTNGMFPTPFMGCGTWGSNIVSENITLRHYMSTTWMACPLPGDIPSNQELSGDYFEKGMDEE